MDKKIIDLAIILVILICVFVIIKKQIEKSKTAKNYKVPSKEIETKDVRSSFDAKFLAMKVNAAFSFWLFGGGDFTDRGELVNIIFNLSDSEILLLNNTYYDMYKESLYNRLNSAVIAIDNNVSSEVFFAKLERLGIAKK